MSRMRLALLVLAIPALAQAAPTFEGMWLTCMQNASENVPYKLVEVVREGDHYSAIQEWGVSYAQFGIAFSENGHLSFRGCPTYKGEIITGCDEKNPPIFLTISAADIGRKPVNRQTALKLAQPIKTSKSEWQSLAKQCRTLYEKRSGDYSR